MSNELMKTLKSFYLMKSKQGDMKSHKTRTQLGG